MAIAATPCDRPTARLGVGTLVAEGRVLTAAHVVEDDLRDVAVDGQPARVVALDPRIDVAILSVESDAVEGDAATFADADIADVVRIVTPTEVIETTVERIVTLTVDDTTDRVVRIAVRRWCSTARCPVARVAHRSSATRAGSSAWSPSRTPDAT